MWSISNTSAEFDYYFNFSKAIATTTYKNMDQLAVYANDTVLNSADLLTIVREIKTKVPLTSTFFTYAITEVHEKSSAISKWRLIACLMNVSMFLQMGICQTSSQYHNFTNPFFNE
jgi:hypothetical protein